MLKLTTVFFLIGLAVLAVLHYLALAFALYWAYPWFDIPMHLFGGIVVALGVFTLYDLKVYVRSEMLRVLPVFLLSLMVILGWEVFKLYAGKVIDDDFVIDTLMDVTLGSVGSMLGYYLATQLRTL